MKWGHVTLQQNSYYEILLHQPDQILQLTWEQTPSFSNYQSGMKAFLESVVQMRAKKLLLDSLKRGNPLPEDLLFITHEVVPILCEHDVRQLAFVVPSNPNHARELELCLMTGQVCYELQFFHTCSDALAWLKTAPNALVRRAVA